jgi:hypothetical protein
MEEVLLSMAALHDLEGLHEKRVEVVRRGERGFLWGLGHHGKQVVGGHHVHE